MDTNTHQSGLYGSSAGDNILRAAIAEAIGTFILVLAGISVATAAILNRAVAGEPYGSVAIALAFGLALAAVVVALGHVSGAHLNPAVTIGLATVGRFPWKFTGYYVAAQTIGATAAALTTWMMFGSTARTNARVAATYLAPDVSIGAGLVTETIVTFILVFIVVSVATDDRVPAAAAGPAIGAALAIGVFIAGPITGGAVNPARAIGPMIIAGDLADFWVYIVGPVTGGTLAALVYDRFIADAETPE